MSSQQQSLFAASLVVLCVVLCDARQGASADEMFRGTVAPFLKRYCIDCHSGDEPEGKLSLDRFKDISSVLKQRTTWLKIQKMLRSDKMPPKDEAQPEREAVDRIIGWIDTDVLKLDCQGPQDPGRVTLRRLNRTEYNNTIRSLVGVDFEPGKDFPADDVGYGFDNNGDVLTMSPLLMEKYMAAAKKIVGSAIVTEGLLGGKVVRFEGAKLSATGSGRVHREGVSLNSSGEAVVRHKFDRPGQYIVRVQAFAQQAGDEPARISMRLDGKDFRTIDVKATSAEPETVYQARVDIKAGDHTLAMAFINDYYNPKSPDPNNRDRNLFVRAVEIQGPLDAKPRALPDSHKRIIFTTPVGSGRSVEDCARDVLRRFASRVYRNDVSDHQLERLVTLVRLVDSHGESYERAIQLAVQALLVSPQFLFRVEHDQFPENAEKSHLIREFELATRLSYFLWSTMPDEELFKQARAGTLRKNLDAQVRRMMKDEKSQALVENFAGQWLELRKLDMVTPDAKLFAPFDANLRDAMRTESEMFFAEVKNKDLSVLTFLDGKFSFLNESLAKHYGISGVSGEKFRRVALEGTERSGVLTHGSVLTVTSNPTRTSPVKRGKWIMEQILGTPPPPPPPGVVLLSEDADVIASASLRKRMEIHRTNPSCAICHDQMDALGFGFENYDAIGRWRTKDGKFDIDPSGVLPGGKKFADASELKQVLKSSQSGLFVRCLAEKMLTYALGRGVEFYDKCALDRITGDMAQDENRFSSLILHIIHSQPFQKRRAKRDP